MHRSTQVNEKPDLYAEADCQRDNEWPELGELLHGEIPSGHQRQRAEIETQQNRTGEHAKTARDNGCPRIPCMNMPVMPG